MQKCCTAVQDVGYKCQLGRAICILLQCHSTWATNEDMRQVKLAAGIWKSEMKQIVIKAKLYGLDCRCRFVFQWVGPRLHSGWCVTAVLSSVNLSKWIPPFRLPRFHHMRYEGKMLITNQQMVSLIHSHVNWSAEMHSCTLRAAHIYNIYTDNIHNRLSDPCTTTHCSLLHLQIFKSVSYFHALPCFCQSMRSDWFPFDPFSDC